MLKNFLFISGKKRSRKLRHVQRYPGNAYFLLDDTDGDDESQWNVNRYRENDNDDIQQQQQQQQQESNPRFENLNRETTTTSSEAKWGTVKESYDDHVNYWETTTSWYWNTTPKQSYQKEITPTYRDISGSSFWQTSTNYPFWRENIETITTTNTTLPIAHTTVSTTTSASSIHEVASDVTEEFIWGRLFIVTPTSSSKLNQPLALPMKTCPHRFDAVTRAYNGRTYVFARDRVYQLWRHDNLHQKASFHINEMFPDGPRTVTVAYTNSRSGVTVLIEHQTVYRYRWNRKNKVFYVSDIIFYVSDIVTYNGRTYVFARDRVYQLWRHDNLHQKASFHINEMFPDGPRTVTVAYTNSRSGVTVLIEHQTVYRYRWNRKNKVFYLARKSPQTLTKKMPVYPRAGFQWIDGNQVLVEGDNFATYDAYWNVATFSGLTTNYFPQFPRDLIGLTYQNSSLFILYTASNSIQIYDTGKYRVIQEYPIQISEFVGCSDD
ncbi:hypothetical protein LOAG_18947 [Loa loa]|uniref:Uncharacterized protein n=1 Tax=Loa loa TaxID=7209 RepID=A0A1S0UDH6_LOALO|nr:hypothetical protein LOAG_18947 [Loa loa]EJD73639.1 hypothetical protein LOAG_18947 [Loa loa]